MLIKTVQMCISSWLVEASCLDAEPPLLTPVSMTEQRIFSEPCPPPAQCRCFLFIQLFLPPPPALCTPQHYRQQTTADETWSFWRDKSHYFTRNKRESAYQCGYHRKALAFTVSCIHFQNGEKGCHPDARGLIMLHVSFVFVRSWSSVAVLSYKTK